MREQIGARNPLDALLGTELAPAVRIGSIQLAEHGIDAEPEGRVSARLDLAEQQPTLLFDLVCTQRREQCDLGNQPEKRLPMARERLAAHLRGLDLAVRVETTADVFRARRQLHRRAAGGAAKHRAVEKVRDARGRFGFEARARANLQRDGDDADRGVLAD